ncbi:hypothetical protein GQ600_4021 [Phytophthora cactorum]|nr:hypothetical protein GQ600_4021 [Phytophthora cactorum]
MYGTIPQSRGVADEVLQPYSPKATTMGMPCAIVVCLRERRIGTPTVFVNQVNIDTLRHHTVGHLVSAEQSLNLNHVVVVGVAYFVVTTVSSSVSERQQSYLLAIDRHPVLQVGYVRLDTRGGGEIGLHDFVGHDNAQGVVVLGKVLNNLLAVLKQQCRVTGLSLVHGLGTVAGRHFTRAAQFLGDGRVAVLAVVRVVIRRGRDHDVDAELGHVVHELLTQRVVLEPREVLLDHSLGVLVVVVVTHGVLIVAAGSFLSFWDFWTVRTHPFDEEALARLGVVELVAADDDHTVDGRACRHVLQQCDGRQHGQQQEASSGHGVQAPYTPTEAVMSISSTSNDLASQVEAVKNNVIGEKTVKMYLRGISRYLVRLY